MKPILLVWLIIRCLKRNKTCSKRGAVHGMRIDCTPSLPFWRSGLSGQPLDCHY